MIYALPIVFGAVIITMIVLFILSKAFDNLVCWIAGWAAAFAALCMVVATWGEISDHAKDLGAVRSSTEIMEFADQRVSELEKSYEKKYGVQAPTAALMNSDKPVEGVAKELATAVKDRSTAQKKLLGSKVRIEQRKLGWYAFIPAFMGDK